MPTVVLDLLKYLFLVVLYIFVARAVRAVYLELKPGREAAPAPRGGTPSRTGGKRGKAPRRATVVEGETLRGKTFELGEEFTIGRAEKCHLVLADDPYVSQVHARIFSKDEAVMVEDLGSTNGTYVNRRRITGPTELKRGDRVKIGKTVLEVKR